MQNPQGIKQSFNGFFNPFSRITQSSTAELGNLLSCWKHGGEGRSEANLQVLQFSNRLMKRHLFQLVLMDEENEETIVFYNYKLHLK